MPRKDNKAQINITLTPEQKTIIEAAITRDHSPLATWVRQAIRQRLETEGVDFPPDAPIGQGRRKRAKN